MDAASTPKITITLEGRETIIWFVGRLLLRYSDQKQEIESNKEQLPPGISWMTNAYMNHHWKRQQETEKTIEQAMEMMTADPEWNDHIANQLKSALAAYKETKKPKI